VSKTGSISARPSTKNSCDVILESAKQQSERTSKGRSSSMVAAGKDCEDACESKKARCEPIIMMKVHLVWHVLVSAFTRQRVLFPRVMFLWYNFNFAIGGQTQSTDWLDFKVRVTFFEFHSTVSKVRQYTQSVPVVCGADGCDRTHSFLHVHVASISSVAGDAEFRKKHQDENKSYWIHAQESKCA
jgi:hypothetical protein